MTPRNRLLLAMIAALFLGYMPWYNFSAVLKYISADFGLTTGDTGLILAAFQTGYVVVVPLTGWLGDRIGLKPVVLWATLSTGVFSTLFAFAATDLTSTLALRLLTGLSAGAIYAPGLALLSRWFPPSLRARALGAYTGAVVASYAGGYFVAAPLAAAFGWRVGVLSTSLPALLGALLVYLLVHEHPQEDKEGEGPLQAPLSDETQPSPAALPAPEGGFGGPAILTTSYMGHMWELYAFWGWIGPFLVASARAFGMPAAEAVTWGGTAAAAIILVGAPAPWLWGLVADRKGRTWAIVVAAGLSAGAEYFLGFLFGHSLALTLLVAAWIGFWVIADSALYKAALTEMVRPDVRGTYLGLQSSIGYSMTIVSPLAFGAILEWFNRSADPTEATVWGPAFLMLGLGALLAPASALLLRRHPQARLMGNGRP